MTSIPKGCGSFRTMSKRPSPPRQQPPPVTPQHHRHTPGDHYQIDHRPHRLIGPAAKGRQSADHRPGEEQLAAAVPSPDQPDAGGEQQHRRQQHQYRADCRHRSQHAGREHRRQRRQGQGEKGERRDDNRAPADDVPIFFHGESDIMADRIAIW
jgi:hypothetical protein